MAEKTDRKGMDGNPEMTMKPTLLPRIKTGRNNTSKEKKTQYNTQKEKPEFHKCRETSNEATPLSLPPNAAQHHKIKCNNKEMII